MQAFPEIDRAGWFGLDAAREKLNPAQAAFVDRLEALLAGRCSARGGSRTHTSLRTVGFKPTASDQFRHPGVARDRRAPRAAPVTRRARP